MKKEKLILPISIILGCIILGGFFYASQVNKQESVEQQQQKKLETEIEINQAKIDADIKRAEVEAETKQVEQQAVIDKENKISKQKAICVIEAQESAVEQYKNSSFCTGSYPSGECGKTYLTANYDNYYERCLQKNGLK